MFDDGGRRRAAVQVAAPSRASGEVRRCGRGGGVVVEVQGRARDASDSGRRAGRVLRAHRLGRRDHVLHAGHGRLGRVPVQRDGPSGEGQRRPPHGGLRPAGLHDVVRVSLAVQARHVQLLRPRARAHGLVLAAHQRGAHLQIRRAALPQLPHARSIAQGRGRQQGDDVRSQIRRRRAGERQTLRRRVSRDSRVLLRRPRVRGLR